MPSHPRNPFLDFDDELDVLILISRFSKDGKLTEEPQEQSD